MIRQLDTDITGPLRTVISNNRRTDIDRYC